MMQTLLKKLREFSDDELLVLSEAIDVELERRLEKLDSIPESARRRAVMRDQSYRKSTGASAPPIRIAGLKGQNKRRSAA
jgi:hypothetical protein